MRSYVIRRLGILGRIKEFLHLYRMHTHDLDISVKETLLQIRGMQQAIESKLERPLRDHRLLEIGVGQRPARLLYFSSSNEAVGIDLDVVTKQFGVREAVRLLQKNGWLRASKTVIRKLLGIDRKFLDELRRQMGVRALPEPTLLQMDATKMDFPDSTFDVVYSHAVFEHLPDASRVIDEACRVLKPGGVLFVVLHLYTSDSGCHDARILSGQRQDLPMWPHLRADHESKVQQNSYLNKLRLRDWRYAFAKAAPGTEVRALMDAPLEQKSQLEDLRRHGFLTDYSDEELLTVTVEAAWTKPLRAT